MNTQENKQNNTTNQENKATQNKLIQEAKIIEQKKLEKIEIEKKTNTSTNKKNTQIEIQTQPIIIPNKYNIKNMAFFSQAPYGNRNQPYQDACEEASLLI
jgi:hypothetical protein